MSFEEDLAAAEIEPAPFTDVTLLIAGKTYVFRFRQMDGQEWASLTDQHPARPGVLIDQRYGYNLRTLTVAAVARSGVRLDGETEVELRVDPFVQGSKEPRVNEWAQVLKAVGGYGFQRVTDAIWGLNERLPELAIEAAKKALASSAND